MFTTGDARLAEANRVLEQARQQRALADIDRTARRGQLERGQLPTIAALTAHEKRNFRMSRLLSVMADASGGTKNGHIVPGRSPEHCLETEIHDGLRKDLGDPPHGGVWVPFSIQASGLDTNSSAGGGYTIPTLDAAPRDIIEFLRNSTMVLRLGARFLPGVGKFGNAMLPRESNTTAATWISDNGSGASASDSTFDQLNASPHPAISATSFSRKLLAQSSVVTDNFISARLAKAFALAVDLAAISGSGSSNQPVGLLNIPGVSTVSLTGDSGSGATPTVADLSEFERVVFAANAPDDGTVAWLTNAAVQKALRGVTDVGSAMPVLRGGKLLDRPFAISQQIATVSSKNALILGCWSQMLIFEFEGALEVILDPVTMAAQGMIKATAWGSFDVVVSQSGPWAITTAAK